jgi:LPXTG-motif cell wall-anchored protein
MSETDVIFVLLGFLAVLLLFGVFVNARRRHDVHRRQGRPEVH